MLFEPLEPRTLLAAAAPTYLDLSFGTAGTATIYFPSAVATSDAVVQADGKIVVCGYRFGTSAMVLRMRPATW